LEPSVVGFRSDVLVRTTHLDHGVNNDRQLSGDRSDCTGRSVATTQPTTEGSVQAIYWEVNAEGNRSPEQSK
jgi:hypothetical protein